MAMDIEALRSCCGWKKGGGFMFAYWFLTADVARNQS
jgi:hypothetical protein